MKQQLNPFLYVSLLTIFVLLCFTGCSPGKEVSTASKEEIAQAIGVDAWKFTALFVNPQYGRSRNVNGSYLVKFNREKMEVYLPYFGRAYGGADVMSGRSPLDFTTTDFSFEKEQDRKGAWVITIKPKDYSEVQIFLFTLEGNGRAELNIQLTNRSPISFRGIIDPVK